MSAAEQANQQPSFRSVFGTTLAGVGIVLGAASFFLLLHQGFQFGIAEPLRAIFEEYDSWVQAIGELVKPLFVGLLALLNSIFDWKLHLVPAWKHFMVAYGALASTALRASWYEVRPFAIFLALAILAFGLLGSVAPEGSPDLSSANTNPWAAFIFGVMLLLLGVFVLWVSRGEPLVLRVQASSIAWVLLSLPLAVIFLLLTNSGLQVVSS